MLRLINIGFGNMVAADRIIAIASPDSAPVKRLIQDARERHRVVDCTQGRRTRAVHANGQRSSDPFRHPARNHRGQAYR